MDWIRTPPIAWPDIGTVRLRTTTPSIQAHLRWGEKCGGWYVLHRISEPLLIGSWSWGKFPLYAAIGIKWRDEYTPKQIREKDSFILWYSPGNRIERLVVCWRSFPYCEQQVIGVRALDSTSHLKMKEKPAEGVRCLLKRKVIWNNAWV